MRITQKSSVLRRYFAVASIGEIYASIESERLFVDIVLSVGLKPEKAGYELSNLSQLSCD